MPRLIYFRQEEQLPAPPPTLPVGDDSDSWWAGAQRCFVAIPLAATLAALTLSASLAFSYQQQTEDIVEQPPQTEDYWQVSTPPRPMPTFLYLPDPEELPAGSLLAFIGMADEDFWSPPVFRQSFFVTLWVDDEVSATLTVEFDEDYWWTPLLSITPRSWPVFLVDDDGAFVAPGEIAFEDDSWDIQHARPSKVIVIVW